MGTLMRGGPVRLNLRRQRGYGVPRSTVKHHFWGCLWRARHLPGLYASQLILSILQGVAPEPEAGPGPADPEPASALLQQVAQPPAGGRGRNIDQLPVGEETLSSPFWTRPGTDVSRAAPAALPALTTTARPRVLCFFPETFHLKAGFSESQNYPHT